MNKKINVVNLNINFVVGDSETIDIEAGTGAVDVDVETTDPVATVEISGNEDLIVGENVLTILVTAAD